MSREGPDTERFVDECGSASDADPGGHYLLSSETGGQKSGIYEVSVSDRKCIPLLPGVATVGNGPIFARDGKSFFYPVASNVEYTVYRQSWSDGKLIGTPQVALKLPFTVFLVHADFSRDLSTVAYARPGSHADLYLLSQK